MLIIRIACGVIEISTLIEEGVDNQKVAEEYSDKRNSVEDQSAVASKAEPAHGEDTDVEEDD